MDNVTHTLIGIAAAEPLAMRREPRDRARLWVVSAVANNLPDLDVLYTWGAHDRLTYMLHHRGHSHTLLLAPLLSLLWLAILRLWWRKHDDIPWRSVTALCFLGPFLHLFADSWNSYGVHPFWPFDNSWYYGDLIFIVEPWLWALLLPLVWKRASSLPGKGVALALLAVMAGLIWTHRYVPWPVALAVTLTAGAWLAAQRFLADNRARLTVAFAGIVLLFGTFAWASLGLKRAFAGEGTEIAALPDPGNPFCWTVLAAGFHGDQYRAAAWTAAPWPALVPASACRSLLRAGPAGALTPMNEVPTEARAPIGEFRAPRAEYDALVKSCRVRAYLRFARIPFWKIDAEGRRLGDLRFDGGFRFAELSGERGGGDENCLAFEPPWLGRFYPSSSTAP